MEESKLQLLASKLIEDSAKAEESCGLSLMLKNCFIASLEDVLGDVSRIIEPFSFRIKKIMFNDGKMYYAVVNTVRATNAGGWK